MAFKDIEYCNDCSNRRECGSGFISSGVLLKRETDRYIDSGKNKPTESIDFEAITLLIKNDIIDTIKLQRTLQPDCTLSDSEIRYNIASTQG